MRRKYLWDGWFKTKHFVLERWIDYDTPQSAICATIRNEASKRGLYVSVKDLDTSVEVQVVNGRRLVPFVEKVARLHRELA